MKIDIIGAGPAGLHFASLMKRLNPRHEITIHERGPRSATWGFGVVFSDQALDFLRTSFENLGMTARAYDRVVKVARTIADLAGEEQIAKKHVAEALAYRALDQKYWYENNNVL